MKNSRLVILVIIIFQFVALGWLIYRYKSVEIFGTEFKFKCRVVDPANPIMGRYIDLSYENGCVPGDISKNHVGPVYLILKNDSLGFGKAASVSNKIPNDGENYLYFQDQGFWDRFGCDSGLVRYSFPFSRFYMNEKLAPKAEDIYVKSVMDSTTQIWAKVFIYKGNYVLKDVMVNGISIQRLAEK